jgi:hypothetical protein
MMNMVPLTDISNGDVFLQTEYVDFLAPLEILKGSSLCTYELNSKSFIKDRIIEVEQDLETEN